MTDIYDSIYRSSDDQMIAGVCAGLAHKLQMSTGGMRLIFLILGLCSVGLPVYLVLWLLLKPVPTKSITPSS